MGHSIVECELLTGTRLPSSLRIAWKAVLKPRHFLGVRLAVMTMS